MKRPLHPNAVIAADYFSEVYRSALRHGVDRDAAFRMARAAGWRRLTELANAPQSGVTATDAELGPGNSSND